MADKEFTPQDSLRIIQTMIEKTKQNISYQSHYFLLWGWGAFIGFAGQYLLKVYFEYPWHYQIWWISAVCLVINIVFVIKFSKKIKVRTYVEESMGNLWTGLIISFIVLMIIFTKTGWQNCYPFFMLLYGTGTFISVKILRFSPLILGGSISFILAAASVWFNGDFQMVLAAVAILFSYIIPGHLLYNNYKIKSNGRKN
ncbi:MAG: hypothetical protein ABJA71_03025 [Ginsengibacter sp.]